MDRGIKAGSHVKIHPATDLYMMGHTQGTVEKVGIKYFHVRSDRNGALIKVLKDDASLPQDSWY